MPLFNLNKTILTPISEKRFDLEKDIQVLTEKNLREVFGLKFVSGRLNQEFSVRTQEQDFYIDTLAFDEAQNSLVIIEYKKDKSFSVIDQGFAYLAAMLNNKAEFVLELNEKLGKKFTKKDIDWEQSRIIFISNEFTNYQKNAINFKDLPMFLYEVKIYDNATIDYNPIKPFKTSESINKFIKDKNVQKISKEIKVYTVDDLVKPEWTETKELLEVFEDNLEDLKFEVKIKYTKYYIAYISKHGRNFVEAVPQKQGLKIYFRFPVDYVKSDLKIGDCSKVGHWTNGNSYVLFTEIDQLEEILRLSEISFKYLHKDIYEKE